MRPGGVKRAGERKRVGSIRFQRTQDRYVTQMGRVGSGRADQGRAGQGRGRRAVQYSTGREGNSLYEVQWRNSNSNSGQVRLM